MTGRPRLVFATGNPGKAKELRELLADVSLDVVTLDELDERPPEVEEDGETFLANAVKKARAISAFAGLPALADDSGLEVDALDGAPGVYSARYAGVDADDDANNTKLLKALEAVEDGNRAARFRSVLALADESGELAGEVITCEGACEGEILRQRRGSGGFGYDPLFFVPELGRTFAELGIGTKNDRSHRARAMRSMKPKLLAYFRLAKAPGSG
jgi:XTP/dITP diphosphohydrolase